MLISAIVGYKNFKVSIQYFSIKCLSAVDRMFAIISVYFYRASSYLSYASAVLAIVIISVRLSHACFDKSKQCTADTVIPHERAITLVL